MDLTDSIVNEAVVTDLDELVTNYERDGVIRVRHLFNDIQLSEMRAAIERYATEVLPSVPTGDRTYEVDGVSVRNLWRMEQHDEYFLKLANEPGITNLVSRLVHGKPILLGVETFNKPALTGAPPMSQTWYVFPGSSGGKPEITTTADLSFGLAINCPRARGWSSVLCKETEMTSDCSD